MSQGSEKGGPEPTQNVTLEEFGKPSYEQWREEAEKSLKGAPFGKMLLTGTPEGITLDPIYNPSDAEELAHTGGFPGEAPYVRGAGVLGRSVGGDWIVSQEVDFGAPAEVNSVLLQEVSRGGTGINLVVDAATAGGKDPDDARPGQVGFDGVSIATVGDLSTVLDGLDTERLAIRIHCGLESMPMISLLAARCGKAGVEMAKMEGCVGADPLGFLSRRGELDRSLEGIYDRMAAVASWAATTFGDLRTIIVSGRPYHEAGASAVEELGLAIATGIEYLRALTERGLSADMAASSVEFELCVGSSFFMEIAKLRAARMLWATVVEAFGGSAEAGRMRVHVGTSRWNMTARDPWVNMLRGATETFSAAVGGADSVSNIPFDRVVREPDAFSRRIARNTQVVLHSEANLAKVIDPAGGSWYVESLTDKVARRAWEIMQGVEEAGGMAKALNLGGPQGMIGATAAKRIENLNTRRSVLIGTNIYANLEEKHLEPGKTDPEERRGARAKAVEEWRTGGETGEHQEVLARLARLLGSGTDGVVGAAVDAAGSGATIGELTRVIVGDDRGEVSAQRLPVSRAAQPFEALRDLTDGMAASADGRPRVFLANMGPIPQHKARADFTTGFFEVAGFEVVGNNGFETPEEAAGAAIESGATISVVCSTDPTYPDLVPPYVRKVKAEKPDAIVILAGFPRDQVDAHRESGVDEFIHMRADNYKILSRLLEVTGGKR